MAKIDLEVIEELAVRLEWLEMALAGNKDGPGIIDQLGALYAHGSSSVEDGVLLRLDRTIQDARILGEQISALEETLSKPLNTAQTEQIESTVSRSIENGSAVLKAELADISKASQLAAERITASAAQADISLREASDQLASSEDSLHQILPQVTQQLRAVINEAQSALGSETAINHLKGKVEQIIKELVVDAKSESLSNEWSAVLERFMTEQKASFKRHSEAIEEIVIDTQAENLERVKKLIDHRAPSDVIVKLFEDLDASRSENEMLRKKLSNAGVSIKTNSLIPQISDKNKAIIGATLVSSVSVLLGAAGMWSLLIGFG